MIYNPEEDEEETEEEDENEYDDDGYDEKTGTWADPNYGQDGNLTDPDGTN